jgi:hypothetical protein
MVELSLWPREADVGSDSAGTTKSNFRLRCPQLHRHARPTAHKKIESSLLNGNLMVPAGHPSIFSSDDNAMEAESLETRRFIGPSSRRLAEMQAFGACSRPVETVNAHASRNYESGLHEPTSFARPRVGFVWDRYN